MANVRMHGYIMRFFKGTRPKYYCDIFSVGHFVTMNTLTTNEDDRIYYDPIFDYSDFIPDGHNDMLCDCTLVLQDGTTLKSHTMILANSSLFFLNAFTSGMAEEQTKTVKVDVNPGNLFPEVLNWMYCGKIAVTQQKLMPLLEITRFYGIEALLSHLTHIYQQLVSEDVRVVIDFVKQCYDMALAPELEFLIPTIAKNIQTFDMKVMSENFDVTTFFEIIQRTSLTLGEKVSRLTSFLGDYQLSHEEKVLLHSLFKGKNQREVQTLLEGNKSWVDPMYL